MDLEEALKEIDKLKKQLAISDEKIHYLDKKLSKETKEKLLYKSKYEELLANALASFEKVKIDKQKRFGVKSEKEKQVLNEAEANSPKKSDVITKRGRKPGVSPLEKYLDSIVTFKRINITSKEYQELLKKDGYIKISENSCHKLEYIPGHFEFIEYVVDQIKDLKNETILPSDISSPFPNSYLTPSLASEIIINKYLLGIPLDRMEKYWNKQGVPISKMNLANYVIDASYELYPLYESIKSNLLKTKYKILHADETSLRVLDAYKLENKEKKRKKSYIWLYATSKLDYPMLIYDFSINRSAKNPKQFLKEYKGLLEVDGYGAYDDIENVKVCCCWAHARRQYTDLISSLSDKEKENSYAVTLLKKIDNIFHLDKLGLEQTNDMEEYLSYRKEKIKPFVDEYFETIEKEVDGSIGKLRKAMQYSINQKEALKMFLTDAKIPLTNNLAERAIKPFVMSRRNFLFSKSISGAEASAVIMSIVQTAKENGLEVQAYLQYLFENMFKDKQSKIENYLPWSEDMQKRFSVIKNKRV